MDELLSRIGTHKELGILLSLGSIVMFVGSIVLVPWLVARAPEDFFVRSQRESHGVSLALLLARNLLGAILLLFGLLMLLLPGQGLLTIVVGLSLLDFPGKHQLQRKLVRRKSVARALQWLRARQHKPPFVLP